jgi:hypothetical protein
MLEARKETRGRFRTNQRVAKVMGRGSHEIGLIAEDVRLVIEIDGEQHRTLTQTRRAASVRDYEAHENRERRRRTGGVLTHDPRRRQLNCCVTDTNDAVRASRTSTILAKSASDRVKRSTL